MGLTFNTGLLSDAIKVSSTLNVGIGTSSPGASLDISSTATYVLNLNNTAQDTRLAFQNSGTQNFQISTSSSQVNLYGPTNIPMLFYTNATERMRITSGGNVLIGTTSDDGGIYRLQVATAADVGLKLRSSAGAYSSRIELAAAGGGASVINTQGGSNILYVSANNTNGVYLTSGATSWAGNSDIRLKDIIKPIKSAVQKLSTLNPIVFSWKSDETKKEVLGLIAQDVEKAFPEVIHIQNDEMKTMGVRYTELIPVLIKAIQELKAEIDELKNK